MIYSAKLHLNVVKVPLSSSTILVAILSRKRRSWVTNITLPEKSLSNFSNHSMDEKSK